MASGDYEIRPIDEARLADLVPLFRTVYGRRVDPATLRLKYDTSYLGASWFGHLAYDASDRPVAYNGAFATRMEHRGRTELSAQFGDTMTLVPHRGRGLFRRLTEATDRQLAAAGIRFVWGLPNQSSERGSRRYLGWRGSERLRAYSIPVRTLPLERIARRFGLGERSLRAVSKRLAAGEVSQAPLPHSAGGGDAVVASRDAESFAYKLRSGSRVVATPGGRAWVRAGGGLRIGDLEARRESEVLASLSALRGRARALGLERLVFQSSPGTPVEQVFSRHFTGFDTWLVAGKSFDSSFPLERLRCTSGDVDTF